MSVLAAGATALTQAAYLADDTDVGDETHKAGPIAILVIVILCIACFLLFRSMSRHLRNVREEFPERLGGAPTEDDATGPTAGDAAPEVLEVRPAAPHAPTADGRRAPKTRPRTSHDTTAR